MILGVFQVYNIIGHHQDILNLSESVKMLAAWWRHYISIPFDWIGWELSALQRETLVLIAFFGSAANLAHLREKGRGIIGIFPDFSPPVALESEKGRAKGRMGTWAMRLVVIGALLFVFYEQWLPILIIAAVSAVGMPLVMAGYLSQSPLLFVGILLLIPAMTLYSWVEAIAYYRHSVIFSLRYLLLLLVADLAARYALDPLLQRLPQLSYPPGPAR